MWLAIATLPPSHAESGNRFGIEIATSLDDPTVSAGTIRIRVNGTIEYPLAQNLAEIWAEARGKFDRFEMELDSPGGSLNHAIEVIAVLKSMRQEAGLMTQVRAGDVCASACVPVFMQGVTRRASTATAWMFHGACHRFSNVPHPEATLAYLRLMEEAGLSAGFLCHIAEQGYLDRPGEYWLSGYELFHVLKANVITELIPAWQPEENEDLPFDPRIGPR